MTEITMYTSDRCPYCIRAKRLLDAKGVDYDEIHLSLWDGEARMRLVELTGRFTVPQIIVDGRPLGGYDDIAALDRAGELDELIGVG
jgi:glutaredoxin 3